MRADQKKKDAEAPKIDTVITALERHGMAKDGKLLSYNELLPILQADHAHYPMSHDMLDYILLAMVNTIRGNEGAGELAEVPASLQVDAMFGELEPELTEDERAVFKRGRNAKSMTAAKNATIIDYRMATGFEALVGYLYLSERFERLAQLISRGLEKIGEA